MKLRPNNEDLALALEGVLMGLTEAEVDEWGARREAELNLSLELGRTEAIPPLKDPTYYSLLKKIQGELKPRPFAPIAGEF